MRRIALLANRPDAWHVTDLARAARHRGWEAIHFPFAGLRAEVASGGPPLAHGTATLVDCDAVLVRTMPPAGLEPVVFRMDVLHTLEARGTPVINPPRAIEIAVDKYLATARLDAAGLPVPPTIVCETAACALDAYHRLGGDVVVKPLFGSEGRGITRVSDPDLAWRVFHALERAGAILYLQKFIASDGSDIRVFVLGGTTLAAMRRIGRGDWRTNLARGGRAEPLSPPAALSLLAERAADAVAAPVAGVDLLEGSDGVVRVIEVNAVPGWRGLARACRIDVASELLRWLDTRLHSQKGSDA